MITICPYCERQWRDHTEQAAAIRQVGRCFQCAIQANCHIPLGDISAEARERTGEILEAGRVAQLESMLEETE